MFTIDGAEIEVPVAALVPRLRGRLRDGGYEGHERALTWRVPAAFCRAPCFSSPLRRCLDTARAMGLSPVVDGGLVMD